MANALHYVIIGNGMGGNQAASILRERDPESRITIISAGSLLFYNRYDLPNIFRGCKSWVELLVNPPEYYEEHRINVRRKSLVMDVNTQQHLIYLMHRETVGYDRLIVATGGASFIPEYLKDVRHLMHFFSTYRAVEEMYDALPPGGRVIMLGGDMIGLDLARALIDIGYQVTLVPDERTFWPHNIAMEDRQKYYTALEKMGIEIGPDTEIANIDMGTNGATSRRVVFIDGKELCGDVVMPFYGLLPNIDFMSSSGVSMERGILVDTQLKSSVDEVWAAGDVCQIWSPEFNDYRFYYGYKNVRLMGEIAARNITGEAIDFETAQEEQLEIDEHGHLNSPFWEH
jgi:NAD(P)H-nitrite reductase large subunit